jgi:hypothetical protein
MYIDPNTGGMLFQVLATIFVIASGFILIFSSRIKMFFFRLKRRRSDKLDQAGEMIDDQTELKS